MAVSCDQAEPGNAAQSSHPHVLLIWPPFPHDPWAVLPSNSRGVQLSGGGVSDYYITLSSDHRVSLQPVSTPQDIH